MNIYIYIYVCECAGVHSAINCNLCRDCAMALLHTNIYVSVGVCVWACSAHCFATHVVAQCAIKPKSAPVLLVLCAGSEGAPAFERIKALRQKGGPRSKDCECRLLVQKDSCRSLIGLVIS